MINGIAEIIFGGQIGFELFRLSDVKNPNIVMAFRELNEEHEIGDNGKYLEGRECKVFMTFDNIKSIETVQECLELAKKNLRKQINFESEEQK